MHRSTISARAVLVVPCYNEARRLDSARFGHFLDAQEVVDLIFVNDGSADDTNGLLRQIRSAYETRVTVFDLPANCGKGEAVRRGVLFALSGSWDYIGYWDADLATPLEVSTEWVDFLDGRPDIDWLYGARVQLLGRTIERRATRHYLGRVFATAASLTLGLPVYDTQCGAKLFRRTATAAAVFAEPFLSRWVFDVEVLARILEEHGRSGGGRNFPVYEMALQEWHHVGGSTLGMSQMARAALDLASIAYRLRVRRARADERKATP